MLKVLDLEERFPTGEPTVQLVLSSNGRGGRILEKRAFDQSAASPAYEFLQTVTPKDGHSIVLVNALGAFEAYDDNRNGDSFPNRPVKVGVLPKCGHKSCEAKAWITEEETLSKHYGTFEKHGGIYKHHVNKDPSKSLGTIDKAFWNPRMQRVELLLTIVNDRDKELVKRIADREFPAVSMGCRVQWDVCNICGHRAPTRKDYCEHALSKLRQVLPNGEKVCVHNPSPVFFDISFVYRPADQTGYMLKKVAHAIELWSGHSAEAGEAIDSYEQKVAVEKKISEIKKQLIGDITNIKGDALVRKYAPVAKQHAAAKKKTAEKDIEKLSQYPISVIASSFAAKNAALSTSDIARIFLKQAGLSSPEWLLDRIVAIEPCLDEAFIYDPSLREKLSALVDIKDSLVQPALFPIVEKYAGLSEYLQQEMTGPNAPFPDLPIGPGAMYQNTEPPRTDVLTITDPNTGHMYQTTRGAGMKAHNEEVKHRVLGSVLLSAGYNAALQKLLGDKVPWWIKTPLSIGAGVKTYDAGQRLLRPNRNPTYLTDQGIYVPGNTEFMKVSALTVTTYLDKIAHDVIERSRTSANPMQALQQKIAATSNQTLFTRFFAVNMPLSEKVAALYDVESTALTPEINVEAFGSHLVALLLS